MDDVRGTFRAATRYNYNVDQLHHFQIIPNGTNNFIAI